MICIFIDKETAVFKAWYILCTAFTNAGIIILVAVFCHQKVLQSSDYCIPESPFYPLSRLLIWIREYPFRKRAPGKSRLRVSRVKLACAHMYRLLLRSGRWFNPRSRDQGYDAAKGCIISLSPRSGVESLHYYRERPTFDLFWMIIIMRHQSC